MSVPLEKLIKLLEDSGILLGDTIKDFIPPKANPTDAQELARELVRKKKLTKFQIEEISKGNGKSLTLGNYLLMEKIGSGGMGQVYKAEHRRMKRIVAVKILPAAMTNNKDAIARFEREVEAAAKISHSNIVAAFDSDCFNGIHFLVMELVEGSDLSAYVKRKGPLTIGKSISYILQAADGLDAAHKKGIIHRDIKPANLLLDSTGTVKILDMGLARLSDQADVPAQSELTATGTIMGTVDYMAPEQALNTKTADARADIYALGCTLYYLLSGKALYGGDSLMEKLLAHRDKPIPSLRAASSDVHQELDTVFQKMVAKKVEDRYQTMAQLIVDLKKCGQSDEPTVLIPSPLSSTADTELLSFLNGSSMAAPTTAMPQKQVKRPTGSGRTMLWIGGGILGLLALVAGIVVKMQTKDGTLVVTSSEPDADVQVLNDEGRVEITRKGEKGPISISVDSGKHRLRVQKDGFVVFGQDFQIESGGTHPITAKLIPLPEVATPKPAPAAMVQPASVPGAKQLLAFESPGFDQWIKDVSELPAEQKFEAVTRKLVELNPGFDGAVIHKIENGEIWSVEFLTDHVADISPLRALPGLLRLGINGSTNSIGHKTGLLSDLSPLRGLPIISLSCANNQVSDLTPLRGTPLNAFNCFGTYVSDLTPIADAPVQDIVIGSTPISDLGPLRGMRLTNVVIANTLVKNLSPLHDMPIHRLYVECNRITDLSPLRGMPLDELHFDFHPQRDIELLRTFTTLKTINFQSADEFWEDVGEMTDTPKTLSDPVFQQWLKESAGLSAEEQVVAVSRKLQELNPSFDGKVEHKIETGVVTSLKVITDNVWNIAPVRLLIGLKAFDCSGSNQGMKYGRVFDLSPLEGIQLSEFACHGTLVSDLSPLRGMPLTKLWCGSNHVFDFTPLQGMPLTTLVCASTPLSDLTQLQGLPLTHLEIHATLVTDLSPLKGMPITVLLCNGTLITDFSPLKELPLQSICCDFLAERDTEMLRSMKRLTAINQKPAAEFWKDVEEQASKTP